MISQASKKVYLRALVWLLGVGFAVLALAIYSSGESVRTKRASTRNLSCASNGSIKRYFPATLPLGSVKNWLNYTSDLPASFSALHCSGLYMLTERCYSTAGKNPRSVFLLRASSISGDCVSKNCSVNTCLQIHRG